MTTNKLFLILLIMLSFFISSCDKEADIPELTITASPSTVTVGEEVTFTITGDAETYVIYTGDPGHELEKSHLILTDGIDLDLEQIVLTVDGLEALRPWLQDQIIAYNNTATNATMIDSEYVFAELELMVDVVYSNKEVAKYHIGAELLSQIPGVAETIVNDYFENRSTLLAPEGGFSTGESINRYSLEFKYTYNAPGIYTATVVATNISNKNYEGSGYIDDRTSSASEYNFAREFKDIVITVND